MHHIKGPNKVIADTFSRLDWINESPCLEGNNAPLEMPCVFEPGCDIVQDAKMLEFFLNLPCLNDPGNNQLNYNYLAKQQTQSTGSTVLHKNMW